MQDVNAKPDEAPDLVEQLRETRRMNVPYQLMMDAANEIERLRAKVAELEDRWLEAEGEANGLRMQIEDQSDAE